MNPVPFSANDCAREPIQFSGAIQPHGYLISCLPGDWTIRHVSTNAGALFDVESVALLGETLREYVGEDVLHALADALADSEPGTQSQRACSGNLGPDGRLCDLSVHAADGLVHIEIEPHPRRANELAPTAVAQAMIARIASVDGSGRFHQIAAEQVRQLTGYDRVMVYRFLPDDSGEVIAEARADDMEPYLGLRYPASDIPPQARALYRRNRLRVIPDVVYAPVPLLPPIDASGRPVDLSQHVLRSVSPVHLEYLRNMGVGASMSISIIAGGRLWGLIACHHRAPRLVPPDVRAAADLFGLFVSMRVAAHEQASTLRSYEQAQHLRDAIGGRLAQARDFEAALRAELGHLREAVGADGAALWIGLRWEAEGRTPDPQRVPALIDWAHAQEAHGWAMTDRALDWTDAAPGDGVAGVLAIAIDSFDNWLFLFRNEQVEDVRWSGEPHKALVPTDDGLRIAPRKSFASWRETVRGRSRPWSDSDRRGAERLYRVLQEQRRRAQARAEQLPALDAEHDRQTLRDQQQRLVELAQLFDGLVHLDQRGAERLGSRIHQLERELQSAMRGALRA